jgi:hypothetical protein
MISLVIAAEAKTASWVSSIDVWALGVLLYKLCYYTTPFEEHGPLAIVNAKYTFPAYPVYSPVLQHLIGGQIGSAARRVAADLICFPVMQHLCWWSNQLDDRRWSTSSPRCIASEGLVLIANTLVQDGFIRPS